jgi:predicted DNA-binding protein (MmcQ/YjbR family)
VTPAAFDNAARALPAVTMDIKWGADQVYTVGGKMFAVISVEDPPRLSFKANDLAFEMLTETGVAIPAPYMARAKWVQLKTLDALPDAEVTAYLAQAHALIAAKLTRKTRTELGL